MLVLAIIVYARRYVDPREPLAWTYQVLALCLLIVAIAGRALVGYHPIQTVSAIFALPVFPRFTLIIAAAIIPYAQTLGIGFLSDDFGLAAAAAHVNNPFEAMTSRGFVAFFRPLALFGWWAGGQLWGGAPLGYHVSSLLIHAINSLLVYALGRRLIGNAYAALIASLLFALHPIHVEPVTWPAASADLLCTVFSLTSLLLLEIGFSVQSKVKQRLVFGGALLAFLLALLSKEAALALPGFIVLRILLSASADRTRRAVYLGASYGVVLVAYLLVRSIALGGVGGYRMPLSFWNTAFPSSAMLMLGDFLFPVHKVLFATYLGTVWWPVVLCLMAAAALWWMLGLPRVPANHLWLWLGFFLLNAIPAWLFHYQPSAALEWTRFSYLPTIGLALLFGDICASRGFKPRARVMTATMLIGFAVLTLWYLTPWRQAGSISSAVLKAGVNLVDELAKNGREPTLYVSDLPESYLGAPVFAYCFPQALMLATGRPLAVHLVSSRSDRDIINQETMSHWALGPGDYLVRWEAKTSDFELVRTGSGTR